jgi:serine/threonine protein kinase
MERVGPYVVQEQLGRGGMGVVFRAVDSRSQRQVALKLLTSTDERARRRLQQEAKALGQLQHRNVVSILDVGEDRGRPWLALELVRGRSVKDRLDREGPLSPRDAARLVVAVAQGLDQAHRRGVLHRDLKPGNVLLPDDGSEPKLTDFGLAAFTFDLDRGREAEGAEAGRARPVARLRPAQRGRVDPRVDPPALAERAGQGVAHPLPRPHAGAVPSALRRRPHAHAVRGALTLPPAPRTAPETSPRVHGRRAQDWRGPPRPRRPSRREFGR